MKDSVKLLSFALLLMACLGFYACGNSNTKTETTATEKVDKTGKEYTSAYVCPMHCEGSGSDKAGSCPACKMAYVANPDAKATEAGHEGHDHGDHDGHDHSGHNH